jgi:hypothetical protein
MDRSNSRVQASACRSRLNARPKSKASSLGALAATTSVQPDERGAGGHEQAEHGDHRAHGLAVRAQELERRLGSTIARPLSRS